MTLGRMTLTIATGLASLVLALTTVVLLLTSAGCSSGEHTMGPSVPAQAIVVTGRLVALKDDRPVDGGVDLTLEVGLDFRDLARVPSVFRNPPNQSVLAMHAIVDAAKLGDLLRGRGTRDEWGVLNLESLEFVRQ